MKLRTYSFHVLCLIILVGLCLFRFQEAVFQKVISAYPSPDGYASVGTFQMMIDQAKVSPKILFSDIYHNTHFGMGVLEPGPFSIFWKLYLYIFGWFTNSLQIAMLSVFVIALLNGIFFYLFCYHFLKNHFLSLLGAIFVVSFYNYHYRANGHLFGLGSQFLPILLVAFLISMTQKKNFWSYVWLAVISAVNFNVNEYYGFFGLWITAAVVGYILVQDILDRQFNLKQNLLRLSVCGSLVFVLFLVLYPNQIAGKIFNAVSRLDSNYVKGISHDLSAMIFYSVSQLSDFFVINRYFAAPHQELFYQDTELTFSIGFFVSVFALVNFILLYKKLAKPEKRIIYSSALIILTSFLLCLNPKLFPSLVIVNAYIAPMFRVTYRALVYFNITMTFLFLYTTWLMFKNSRAMFSKTSLYAAVTLILVTIDLPYPHLLQKIYSQNFPATQELQALQNEDSSFKVINLPMFPTTDPMPERSYVYAFEYFYHRKQILNFPFSQGNNAKFAAGADEFVKTVNAFKPDVPLLLNTLGVKFVIYHKNFYDLTTSDEEIKTQLKKMSESKYLDLVIDNKKFSVFKIKDDLADFNTKNLVMDVLTPENQYFDFSASCLPVQGSLVFNCNKKSKARFVNYYDSQKRISATFDFDIASEHISRKLEFIAQPMEIFEVNLRSLVDGRRDDTKVQVSAVRIEDVK